MLIYQWMIWIACRIEIGQGMALGNELNAWRPARTFSVGINFPIFQGSLFFYDFFLTLPSLDLKKNENIFASHERSYHRLLVLKFLKCAVRTHTSGDQEKNLNQKANKEKGVERNRFYTTIRGESRKLQNSQTPQRIILLRKRSCLWLFTILFRRRWFWKLS